MTIPITAAKERMETRQPHTKRITPVASFIMSHKPTSHAKRLPPYRLQQKTERTSLTDQPDHLCSGRLFLTLFPLCISLAVFIITTFFLCISELIRLISCASKGRALGKTRFLGKIPRGIHDTGKIFIKTGTARPCFPVQSPKYLCT